MKRMLNLQTNQKGIALVAALALLTLISLMAVYFLFSIRVAAIKSENAINEVRSRTLARSGLNMSIALLKGGAEGARDNFCDTQQEDWYYTAGVADNLETALRSETSFASQSALKENIDMDNVEGFLYFKIIDAASQLNLNDPNPNLDDMLEHLPGMNASIAGAIITQRAGLPGAQFSHKSQILEATGMTDTIYAGIKDLVTIRSWIDEKASESYSLSDYETTFASRSPVNVNTATAAVLFAVLRPYLSVANATSVANSLHAHVATNPFHSWQEFDSFINSLVVSLGLSVGNANNIKNYSNPNRIVTGGAVSTEFCFHSGGYYSIEVLSEIRRSNGAIAGRKKLVSFVKIFDVVQHTTKNDFRDEDTNNDGDAADFSFGEGNFDQNFEDLGVRTDNTNYIRVTWLDSCPVDEDDESWNQYSGVDPNGIDPGFGYHTIPNAVKLGFWDDFDEDATTNQSAAWWGNEMNAPIEFSDIGVSSDTYVYSSSDETDRNRVGAINPFTGEPTINQLHTVDEVSVFYAAGGNSYEDDDTDNEMWTIDLLDSTHDIYDIDGVTDFSKYFLGAQGQGTGKYPTLYRAYRHWDAGNGFYQRVENYDGPRTSLGTVNNFPGVHTGGNPLIAADAEGRGHQDVGRVTLFTTFPAPEPISRAEYFISIIGNIWKEDPSGNMDTYKVHDEGFPANDDDDPFTGWYYSWDYPKFIARANPDMNVLDPARHSRHKRYKAISDGTNLRFSAESNDYTLDHPHAFSVNSSHSGTMSLYGNATQVAWDEVRVIDNDGRFAKHFVIDEVVDLGAFHFNVTLPNADTHAYYAGAGDEAGVSSVDISLASAEDEFDDVGASFATYADMDVAGLGAGKRALEGPSASGETLFSYSLRLNLGFADLTPEVPAIEDISLSYLKKTIIYYSYFE